MSDKIDFKSKNFLNALLYILTGLLLCIFRAQVLNVLLTVIGALFIAYGVIFCYATSGRVAQSVW